MNYIKLLRRLEDEITTEGKQRHNISLHPETQKPEITVFAGGGWQIFRLEDTDKVKDPETVAQEIADIITA